MWNIETIAIHLIYVTLNCINWTWSMKLLSIEDQRRLLKTSLFFSGLESLHKAVNPDILPREYGGKTYSVEECIGLWREELEHNRSTLLQLDQLKVAGVRSVFLSHHHKIIRRKNVK